MENLVEELGFYNMHSVEPVGKSGGLALMWKESVSVKVIQANRRMIDVSIPWQDKSFFLTCVYGGPVKRDRGGVWERLQRIAIDREGPWMMTGDFNELVDPTETKGGAFRKESECIEFQQTLRIYGMWEKRHAGYRYGIRNEVLVQCRLDRTVANQEWMEMFPESQARYLKKIFSDHSRLITSMMGESWKQWASFKFDQRWIKRKGFRKVVEYCWNTQTGESNRTIAENN